MLRHVVLLTLTDDAPEGQRQLIIDELARLPGIIPEMGSYSVGADAGVSPGNADLVVVGDFDDVDSYQTYATHADHVDIITTHIKPWLAQRSAVQYEI